MSHSTSWLRCCMHHSCSNTFTGDRRLSQEGDLASARSQYQLAISQLKATDEASRPMLLARLAGCHHRLSDAAGALECYEELLQLPAAGAHRNSSLINSAELLRQVHAVLGWWVWWVCMRGGCAVFAGCACVVGVLYILLCLRAVCVLPVLDVLCILLCWVCVSVAHYPSSLCDGGGSCPNPPKQYSGCS